MEENKTNNNEELDSQGSQREPAAMRRGLEITKADIIKTIKQILEFDGFAAAKKEYEHMCYLYATCTGWAETANEILSMLLFKRTKMQEQESGDGKQIINNFNGAGVHHIHTQPNSYAYTYNGPVTYADGNNEEIPLTRSDKDIKVVIEEMLKAKDEKETPVFKNKKQWWAVYRVLSTFCNYPKKMTVFIAKLNDLAFDYAENTSTITYDSLCAAPKDVPLMNCLPSAWGALKDMSENYYQQYVVAEFMMLKLGIKS